MQSLVRFMRGPGSVPVCIVLTRVEKSLDVLPNVKLQLNRQNIMYLMK